MHFLTNDSTDPFFNMAFDEYVLESLEAPQPLFWLWQNRPTVVIGLNQSPYAEVNLPYLQTEGIELVRRVTGGGAVYHDFGNLNYTLTGRSVDLQQDERDYLRRICEALRALGADVSLTGRNDIFVDGKKCCGYAKRVYRDRLMIHGCILFDVDLERLTRALSTPGSKLAAAGIASVRSRVANLRDYLPGIDGIAAFRTELARALGGPDAQEIPLTAQQRAAVGRLADERFRTWEWNFGRSPRADFRASRTFPSCGTVTAAWSIRKGLLTGVSFSGDFLGNRPASLLAARLEGVPFEREALSRALDTAQAAGEGVPDCFDGLDAATLTDWLLG